MLSKIYNFFRSFHAENQNLNTLEATPQSNELIKAEVINTSPDAHTLLKEATQLKRDKKFNDACEKLKVAYLAPGSKDLMVKQLLRLPMYLQLANRSDEGWRELRKLDTRYTDVYSQAEIARQSRVFLQKEKEFQKALVYSAWIIAKEIERDKKNIENCIEYSDLMSEFNIEYDFLGGTTGKEIYGETPSGNLITDRSYEMLMTHLTEIKTTDGILNFLAKDMKKAKQQEIAIVLAQALASYYSNEKVYKFEAVQNIVEKCIVVA